MRIFDLYFKFFVTQQRGSLPSPPSCLTTCKRGEVFSAIHACFCHVAPGDGIIGIEFLKLAFHEIMLMHHSDIHNGRISVSPLFAIH